MDTVKLSDYNAYLCEQVGQPYVLGGQHTKLTPDNYVAVITKREPDETHREDAIAFCKRLFDAGATVLYAYDCSGLGMYFLQNVKHVYDHDMNANRMMQECDVASEPKCGYWLFRLNDGRATHIGYMVSDTEVIHAKGRVYGVVREAYKKSYWHRIGKPRCIEFDEPSPEPQPEPPAPEPPEPTVQIAVKGTVRVRRGNGKLSKKICTVGERGKVTYLPYLGQAPESPYWYMTRVNGQDGYITSDPKYTYLICG